VRLLRLDDVDFERAVIRFRRGKGGKTLDVALHPETRSALSAYVEGGRLTLLGPSSAEPGSSADPGWVFLSAGAGEPRPLTMNALSLMVTRRYHVGGGRLRTFGSHRIRHGTATPPREQRDAARGGQSLSRPLLDRCDPALCQQTTESLGHRAAAALSQAGLLAS